MKRSARRAVAPSRSNETVSAEPFRFDATYNVPAPPQHNRMQFLVLPEVEWLERAAQIGGGWYASFQAGYVAGVRLWQERA